MKLKNEKLGYDEFFESGRKKLKSQIIEMVKKAGYTEEDYNKREREIGRDNMFQLERVVGLKVLDTLWQDNLFNMEHLRDSVRLRAYGGHDPLVEYKNEGHKMFQRLLEEIDMSIANSVFKANLQPQKQSSVSFGRPVLPKSKDEVGRNDPCPCGSGKKYKKYHGK